MFVQVIKGFIDDSAELERQLERWRAEVQPGATGWLGTTGGVADDGTFIAVVRFADERAARANQERPEQHAWWQDFAKLFSGEPTFRESSETDTMLEGGSDRAGFVQVMEGSVTDRARAEAMMTPEMVEQLRAARPDLIGSLRAWFGDREYLEAVYFTSEDEARSGESSSEFEGPEQDFGEVFTDVTYTDLRQPILVSP